MFQYSLDIFSDTASAPASAFGPVSVPFFEPDLASYDHFLIAFSGGKDSVAMVLDLLERGVDPAKIELWHHDVDGREDDGNFMDWPVTADYCRKFAAAFNLRIYLGSLIAVGTLVAERPPHRSVRAAFLHTAPTLSV